MRTLVFRSALAAVALVLVPALAGADIILKNRDGKSYQIAVRHSVAVTRTDVPARSYLIITEGAETVQLRDAEGTPTGEVIKVADGDRLEVKAGRLVKTASAPTARNE